MEQTDSVKPDPLDELDRQVERASLFTHASFDRIAMRASGIQAELHALIETLRDKGVLDAGDLPASRAVPGAEKPEAEKPEAEKPEAEKPEAQEAEGEEAEGAPSGPGWPAIALRGEGAVAKPAVEVNCAERMHVCRAVCCKLSFPLTAPEVDAGKVRFDLGFPYFIRHDADGYCTHNDRDSGSCSVYKDRPGICRQYSCAGDERIWKDFEAMELNHEWLDANLGDAPRIRLRLDPPLMDPGVAAGPQPEGKP